MDIVEESEKFALEEIEKYGWPRRIAFDIANSKGLQLGRQLNADSTIVQAGTRLMDIKLGQALDEGRIKEHVRMSVEAAKEFLKKFDVDEKTKTKILNCIEAHHGTVSFICKEAEIVANADCYRFLTPKGFLDALISYGKMGLGLDDALNRIEEKVEEKIRIVSLDICRKELDKNYLQIKDFLKKARE